MPNPGFCAAPWVEGVLYHDGLLRACCRNRTSFANWQSAGLATGWHSPAYQDFRRKIRAGEFPDRQCEHCWQNGTARSLASELAGPFQTYLQRLTGLLDEAQWQALHRLQRLFDLAQADDQAAADLTAAREALATLQCPDAQSESAQAANKLRVIAQITESYLAGEVAPPVVAPFRQVQLIAKCNARCIQCPGLFTGEIIRGPAMDPRHADEAFSRPGDIIDFFMNGSEFLVFKEWRKVARLLADHGVAFSISTNGILLTPENIRFLVDQRIVRSLNVSIDGATRETIESVRVKVQYDDLVANLRYLFQYASEQQYELNLSISFVLMQCNHAEFPGLVRLIREIQGDYPLPTPHVYCQSLENYEQIDSYVAFINLQHHTQVPRETLVQVFEETLRASRETGIGVNCFYAHKLEDFLAGGCPFPPLPIRRDREQTLLAPETVAQGQAHFTLRANLSEAPELTPLAQPFHLQLPANAQQVSITLDCQLQPATPPFADRLHLFLALGIGGEDEHLLIAREEHGETHWETRQGSLQAALGRDGIPAWRAVETSQPWSWTVEAPPFLPNHPPLDVYFGQAVPEVITPHSVAEFHGAALRVTWSRA